MSKSEKIPADDVEHHVWWIRQLARALVNDPSVAEDLAQDTLAAALQQEPSTIRTARTWMSQVLRNAVRQHRRTEARRHRRESQSHQPIPYPDPAEIVERLETERILTEELGKLEEPFRSTLMLRFYEDLEPTQIANQLGIPAGTVRWRLKRAKELLRKRLDASSGDRRAWTTALIALAHGHRTNAPASVVGSLSLGALSMKYVTLGATLLIGLLLFVGYLLPEGQIADQVAESTARRGAGLAQSGPETSNSSLGSSESSPRRQLLHKPDQANSNIVQPLSLRVIDKETKAPIPGQTLIVFSGTLVWRNLRAVSTDREGLVMIDDLPQGRYRVSPGGKSFELGDGGVECLVELDAKMEITGFVTDGEGQPMPDAEIRSVHCNTSERGNIIALSGGNGRFRVTGYESTVLLYASKSGYAPSVIYDPMGYTNKPPEPIHFVLRPCQLSLQGLVVDTEGQPVANAKVLVRGAIPPVEDGNNEKPYFKSRGRSIVSYHTRTDGQAGTLQGRTCSRGNRTLPSPKTWWECDSWHRSCISRRPQ